MNSTKRMTLINVGVWALLVLAAAVSFTHIVEAAHKLGLHDWQAFTAPALIDFVAIVGKLSMHASFLPPFQRSGFRLLMAGGVVSLACNVYAGDNLGEMAFGVLVVVAFMLLEHHATKAGKTAIVPVQPASRKLDPEMAASRAKKAAATKAIRKAEREAAAEAERWASLTPGQRAAETRARRAAAPVSPAIVNGN